MVTAAQKKKLFRDLAKVDPEFVNAIAPFLEGLYKHYFRCEVTGWENVPDDNAMFIGNHNGLLTFEVLMLFFGWWKRFGTDRRAVGLAHGIALNNPVFSWIIPRIGAIPADPEIALEALDQGYSLMVYPGGEKESFRPYKERKIVNFYQRKGFIRLSLNSGKPIVPVVSIGAHESYIILHRGEEIAEALGLKKKLRLHGVPITYRSIFFLWCLVSGMFTVLPLFLAPAAFLSIFVPLPTKMTFRILPPIDARAMLDPSLTEEENHQRIYDHVVGQMQAVLTEEYAKRRLPIIG